MNEAVLLLGSNLGNPEENILQAIKFLENKAGSITKKSKISKTLPVEFVSSQIFCNIAIILQTDYSPIRLLGILKEIEVEMGRTQDSKMLGSYQDRVIDIDIVSYAGVNFESEKLEIPHHKHLYEREFSKELLEEINF